GKTLESPEFGGFRRCTGRLNATQPGVIAVSTPVHTWIGRVVQGKRLCPATVMLIHELHVRVRLTLWFYCGKRCAGGYGIGGEPRKSSHFGRVRIVVRRSIRSGGFFRRTCCRTAGTSHCTSLPDRLRGPPCGRHKAHTLRSRPRQDHPV